MKNIQVKLQQFENIVFADKWHKYITSLKLVYKTISTLHAESRHSKDVLGGAQTVISWENKELRAKKIDVMLERSLSKICIQTVKEKRKPHTHTTSEYCIRYSG